MAARSGTRRFKLLLVAVLLGLVAWSVVWFVAATIVDRQIARAENMALDRDAILVCAERHVSGYPFRVVVECDEGTKFGASGRKLALGGLRVAAQVYNPSHLIAEVDAPAQFFIDHGMRMEATFDLAHASAHMDLASGMMRQLVAEILDIALDVGGGIGPVQIAELDLSVRRNPEVATDLDVALSVRDVVPQEGLEPANITLRGRLGGGAALLQGAPKQLVEQLMVEGLPFVIESARVECGSMLVAVSGALEIEPNGLIDGDIDVAVAGYEAGLPYASVMNPEAQTVLSGLLTNFFASAPTTMVGDREARMISISIDDGKVKPGGWFTIATLPALPIRLR